MLPDARDVAALDAALTDGSAPVSHVVLTADLGPAQRYRRFLAVSRGTCASSSAPGRPRSRRCATSGCVVIWDDGDDLHAEPRAPYPHARDVLVLRAHLAGAAAARRARGHRRGGPAGRVGLGPLGARPSVRGAGGGAADQRCRRRPAAARDPAPGARLPAAAWTAAREALAADRRCSCRCRAPATCRPWRATTAGRRSLRRMRRPGRRIRVRRVAELPLVRPAGAGGRRPSCRRDPGLALPALRRPADCGPSWSARRARPRSSAGIPRRARCGRRRRDTCSATVPAGRSLVVATPGAEPVAAGRLRRRAPARRLGAAQPPDLRAGEEALRRWLNAAALVIPAADGGRVVLAGRPRAAAVQACPLGRRIARRARARRACARSACRPPPPFAERARRRRCRRGVAGRADAAGVRRGARPGARRRRPVPPRRTASSSAR